MGGKRLEPDLTPADKRVEHVNNVHIKRETRYRFRTKRKLATIGNCSNLLLTNSTVRIVNFHLQNVVLWPNLI